MVTIDGRPSLYGGALRSLQDTFGKGPLPESFTWEEANKTMDRVRMLSQILHVYMGFILWQKSRTGKCIKYGHNIMCKPRE